MRTVAPRTAAAIPSSELLASFPGIDFAGQVARFGNDQAAEPPDTQIAAGPDVLVEATNASLTVWSKAGVLIAAADLNALFGVPAGYFFSDPRVVYDSASGRWFLAGLAFSASTNASLLAISGTSDPSASWLTYGLATSTTVPDQPKLGVSADKVVISWNDFSGPTTFVGEETQVVQKSDLLGSVSPIRSAGFGPDVNRYSPVPAIQQTATNTEFVVYNGNTLVGNPYAGTYAGIARITGTPAAGNVTWDEVPVGIARTNNPPNAAQQGSATTIQTNDDRFLSADWRNGTLWVAGNDACLPPGDGVVRSCLRLVAVSAADTGTTATQLHDFDIGTSGAYAYFPAVATDVAGNLFVSFTGSGAALTPSSEVISMPAGGTAYSALLFAPGPGPYDSTACRGTNRWGDYSGAAVDPSNPNDVWVASELATINSCKWGTAIARLTLAPPTISGLVPFMGPQRGGTTVTITGTEFGVGDTTVSFAGTAPVVTRDSSQQLRVVSPPHPGCGTVAVTVTTSKGTSAPAMFGYVGLPCAASQVTTSAGFRNRVPPPIVR